MTPRTEILEFLTGERGPIPRSTLVTAMLSLGSHSGGTWPQHASEVWEVAIESLITEGYVSVQIEGLRLAGDKKPRRTVCTKPSRKSKPADAGQDLLF